MCDGSFRMDPKFAVRNRKRYKRKAAEYVMRDTYRQLNGKACVYCGGPRQVSDHVPSLFVAYVSGVVDGRIVPSCYECNKRLGPFASTCFDQRLEFLAETYKESADNSLLWGNDKGRAAAEDWQTQEKACRDRMGLGNCHMLDWPSLDVLPSS